MTSSASLTLPQNTPTRQQHQPYHDTPTSSPSPSPTPHTSPSSTDSASTIKPLPPLPVSSAPYTDEEPYRDEHTYRDELSTTAHHTRQQAPSYHHPYTDTPPHTPSDENIPLAHFLRHSYPADSPPSYSVAVRQTHAYRDTLIQYIPNRQRNVVIEIDEESGEVVSRTDDVRHGVEKVVAMFVVAGVLLGLSGALAWLALGRG